MITEAYVSALLSSFLSSVLILFLFYSLMMRVFTNEHVRFSAANQVYQMSTVSERMFFILLHGKLTSRIILIVSFVGLYNGARFLGNDLKIAWELYHMIIVK